MLLGLCKCRPIWMHLRCRLSACMGPIKMRTPLLLYYTLWLHEPSRGFQGHTGGSDMTAPDIRWSPWPASSGSAPSLLACILIRLGSCLVLLAFIHCCLCSYDLVDDSVSKDAREAVHMLVSHDRSTAEQLCCLTDWNRARRRQLMASCLQRVGLASPLLSCHAVFFLRNFLNDACQTASLSFPSLSCVSIFPPSPAPTSAPTTCRIWGATGFCFAYRAHDPKKSTGSVCLT